VYVAGSRKKRGQIFLVMAFRVAGERHVLPGKIHISSFPAEISTSHWEVSSFSYKNKSSCPIRILESSTFEFIDPEIKTLLSGISLITEILLD
jgi:hypothetical protein